MTDMSALNDTFKSTKDKRVYIVDLKMEPDIQNFMYVRAIIGENGGEKSIYTGRRIPISGFDELNKSLLISVYGIMGEIAINNKNIDGDQYYYAIAAATQDQSPKTTNVASSKELEYITLNLSQIDVYFVPASNYEELLLSNEFKKINSIPKYNNNKGKLMAVAFGIGTYNSKLFSTIGLCDKVYNTNVISIPHKDFIGVASLPKPDIGSEEYSQAVTKFLNSICSHYIVQISDMPKEI